MKKALLFVSSLLVASLALNVVLFFQSRRNAELAEEYRLSPPTNMSSAAGLAASIKDGDIPGQDRSSAYAGAQKELYDTAKEREKSNEESRAIREEAAEQKSQ